MESVKRTNVRHQTWALFFEHLPDRFITQLWVFVRLGVSRATILKPGIQLGIGFELWARDVTPEACLQHDEPPPDYTHLVLNLTLLPA